MANVLERLLQLYNRQNKSGKTPLEDFVTEIVIGILQSHQQLLDRFVNEVLLIDGHNFKVNSQVPFSLPFDQNCIIDLVFENTSTICFLENKVASGEGKRQLERYVAVLQTQKSEMKKETYLRYCTKLYDPKKIKECSFYQFRWQRIYEFFDKQEKTDLIQAFLELLRGENMAGVKDFSIEDMMTMKGIYSVMTKMDEILDLTKGTFTELFGAPYQRDFERLKQIPSFNRYSLWTNRYNGQNIEIMMGFELEDEEQTPPLLFVQVYRKKDKEFADKIEHHCEESEDKFDFYEFENNEGKVWAWYETPLINFLTMENQKEQIVEWFAERLKKVKYTLDTL
ncbi:PD-(D/E)XK nuclease family protein [Priestia koreensis]|uniref:PD-(D/E)XK nuclease family protein n=1 Tax=Priestia koreensis TaxID=284581 RepID=UPI003CFDE712